MYTYANGDIRSSDPATTHIAGNSFPHPHPHEQSVSAYLRPILYPLLLSDVYFSETRNPMDGFRSLWREPNRREIPQSSYSTPQNVPWQDTNSSSYHERNDEWRTATEQIVPIQNLHISSNDQFHSSVSCDPSFPNLSQLESFQSPSSFNPSVHIEINHPLPPTRTTNLQLNEHGLENEHEDQMEDAEDQESRNRRRNVTRESTRHLKKWLNAHLSNPYPNKGEKIMLSILSGMSITQVSTWFANARRRIKKENQITWNSSARSPPENSGLTSEISVNPTMNFQPQNPQLSNNWELGGSVESATQTAANCDWTWQGQHGTQHSSHQNHFLNVYSSYFSQA
ncbi:unnamed protein product [Hymenolepis diminuta]|uniref:Homeobox domain-containing protein n=1 Tax=Hymenolepis diminuta TaxID=6216 RepID=A0A0R3SE54_HYMDI|nr:unnamed protein product [Hymenolepis diminuta]